MNRLLRVPALGSRVSRLVEALAACVVMWGAALTGGLPNSMVSCHVVGMRALLCVASGSCMCFEGLSFFGGGSSSSAAVSVLSARTAGVK